MTRYILDLYAGAGPLLRPTEGHMITAGTDDDAAAAARQILATRPWAELGRLRRPVTAGPDIVVGFLTGAAAGCVPECGCRCSTGRSDYRDCVDRVNRVQGIHRPVPDGLPPVLTAGQVCMEDRQPWPCDTELAIRPQPPYYTGSST